VRPRLRRVDSRDARMRVRRAHHDGVGLTGRLTSSLKHPLPVSRRESSLRKTGIPIPAFTMGMSPPCAGPKEIQRPTSPPGITIFPPTIVRTGLMSLICTAGTTK